MATACVFIAHNMSTQARRGRPKSQKPKVRQNITMDPAILKKARRLAFANGLALSTWIDQLIREKAATIEGGDA